MNFLHYKVDAGPKKIIQVNLNEDANVRLLDVMSFYQYKAGKPYNPTLHYTEGLKIQLIPPYRGEWHVVIDAGKKGGNVKAYIEVG